MEVACASSKCALSSTEVQAQHSAKFQHHVFGVNVSPELGLPLALSDLHAGNCDA